LAASVDGDKVRELREAKILERQELADLAGVSYTTIYKMEKHGHLPRFGTVRAVAKVLRVKPDEILVREHELARS
jgi:DNA-binding XRE family transcriptional regulator